MRLLAHYKTVKIVEVIFLTKTQKALQAPKIKRKEWACISERIQCAHDVLVICSGGDETCKAMLDDILAALCKALDYSYTKSLTKKEKREVGIDY